MTEAQFTNIAVLAAEKNIPRVQVDRLTQNFTKEQASHLITQMTKNDWSAFDQVEEDEVPAVGGAGSSPVEAGTGGVEF